MPIPFRIFIAFATLFFLNSCNHEENLKAAKRGGTFAELAIGKTVIQAEIALSRQSQEQGLMHRETLAKNSGMLFVFSAPQQMSFWMRNTQIPLDIAFFTADGVLREYYPLYPFDENARRSIRNDLLYALETNQGWFKKNGVKVGDTLDISKIK